MSTVAINKLFKKWKEVRKTANQFHTKQTEVNRVEDLFNFKVIPLKKKGEQFSLNEFFKSLLA